MILRRLYSIKKLGRTTFQGIHGLLVPSRIVAIPAVDFVFLRLLNGLADHLALPLELRGTSGVISVGPKSLVSRFLGSTLVGGGLAVDKIRAIGGSVPDGATVPATVTPKGEGESVLFPSAGEAVAKDPPHERNHYPLTDFQCLVLPETNE